MGLLGATGADVERLVRGARRLARQAGRPLTRADLEQELKPPVPERSPVVRRRTAVHEAGHALIAELETPGLLIRVTLRPSAAGAGHCLFHMPVTEEATLGLIDRTLRQLLAGRAAEALVYGDVSAGSGGSGNSDLAKATALALASLTTFGLDPQHRQLAWLGGHDAADAGRLLAVRPDLHERVNRRLRKAHQGALLLLRQHRATLKAVVEALLARETLSGEEVARYLAGTAPRS